MKPFAKWMIVAPDGTLAAVPSPAVSPGMAHLIATSGRLTKLRQHEQVDFLALYDSEEAAADAMSGDSLTTYRERLAAGWRIVRVRVAELPDVDEARA